MVFHELLLNWYDVYHRKLPWRTTYSPYTVWLSEIMLQQTQVVTVIDYFKRFVERFPDVYALANAAEDDVFKLWEGLGYYSRARNLMRCARIIVQDYQGVFPSDKQTLMKLPGIGPYTAGAIASIAFEKYEAAVDGNVMRVMSRIHASNINTSDAKNRAVFEAMVMEKMAERPRDFNQALMELGATICSPKTPKCDVCPVLSSCLAAQSDTALHYPVKTKKMVQKHQNIHVLVIRYKGTFLLEKRPHQGLMNGLWGFPHITLESEVSEGIFEAWVEEQFGVKTQNIKKTVGLDHVFTHLIWHMTLHLLEVTEPPPQIDWPEVRWITKDQFNDVALPTAFKKQLPKIYLLGEAVDES